jgi:hypothetical protein
MVLVSEGRPSGRFAFLQLWRCLTLRESHSSNLCQLCFQVPMSMAEGEETTAQDVPLGRWSWGPSAHPWAAQTRCTVAGTPSASTMALTGPLKRVVLMYNTAAPAMASRHR